jgi:hypothetical protein
MELGAVVGSAEGDKGVGSLGLVNLIFWHCWARCPKIVLLAISCHIGVTETIEGVAVTSLNGIQPRLLDREANTGMVEGHKGADAGNVEGSWVVGGCWMPGLSWPWRGPPHTETRQRCPPQWRW